MALLVSLALPIAVMASDGIREINQASILAAGGFPYTINTSGSYVLTSNLVVVDAGLPQALPISAQDVHLDLNGFSLIGPEPCGTTPTDTGTVLGINSNARGVSVVNGTIQGFATGIGLGAESRVANVRVRCAGGVGISVGSDSRVEGSGVSLSNVGIQTGTSALLVDNEVTNNLAHGLVLGAGSALRSNVIADNNGGNSNRQIDAPQGFLELGANRCGNGLSCSGAGVCGDGQIDPGESCDNFNAAAGDGCSATCQVESGWSCAGVPSVCTPTGGACGDGIVTGGESCDDGDAQSFDGCSSTCLVEPGWTCSGQPSICQQ